MKSFLKIVLREWKLILTKKSYYMILLVMPTLLFLLYSMIYNSQALHNIPVAIWDQDQTELSRILTRQYASSPLVKIAYQVHSQSEIEDLMANNKIQGAVIIPRNLEANVYSSKISSVSFIRNATNIIFAELLYKAFAEVTLTVNAGVIMERFTHTGVPSRSSLQLANPVNLTTHSLYNPTYNYQNYLVPGLMTVGLQMMIIMICVLIINSEKEEGTFEELIQLANGSTSLLLLGKITAHYLAGMLNVLLIFGVFFAYFSIPVLENFTELFVLFSLLVLACVSIGVLVSVVFPESLMASDIALFYTSPAFVFSGFTFPRWAMPWYDQYYANLMPYTPFLDGFIKVYQMNAPLGALTPHLLSLVWFITIPLSIGWALLKIQIQNAKNLSLT